MTRSHKDARGGHPKPFDLLNQRKRWWRLRPYGLKINGFIQDHRRDGMHACEMKGRALMEGRQVANEGTES